MFMRANTCTVHTLGPRGGHRIWEGRSKGVDRQHLSDAAQLHITKAKYTAKPAALYQIVVSRNSMCIV